MVAPNPTTPPPADADPLIPVRQLRARCPDCPDVSRFTIVRWCDRGVVGPGGNRVRLRAVKLGSWHTRASWLMEFLNSLTTRPTAPAPTTSSRADRDAATALAADGF